MKSVLEPLGKSITIVLGLTSAGPKADAGVNKKFFNLGQQH